MCLMTDNEGLIVLTGLWGEMDSDLGVSCGLGVAPDCGLANDEGVLMSFAGICGLGIFLDNCQEEVRKPEFTLGRL